MYISGHPKSKGNYKRIKSETELKAKQIKEEQQEVRQS